MKKVVVLSAVAAAVMMAGAANAAEIYNKDGNKLDLYGKVDGLHYFSSNHSTDGDQSYIRMGIKGETQITDQLTGFGQWEYQVNANRPEDGDSSGSRKAGRVSVLLVWHLPIWGLLIMVVTMACYTTLVHGLTYCLNLVMIRMKLPIIL